MKNSISENYKGDIGLTEYFQAGPYTDTFSRKSLENILNSEDFRNVILNWVTFFMNNYCDVLHDDYTHPKYVNINERYNNSKEHISLNLSDEQINYYLVNFSLPQLYCIFFGYWYGLSDEEVTFYARKNWNDEKMTEIINMLIVYDIPYSEIYDLFSHSFNKKNLKNLLRKYGWTQGNFSLLL